MPDTASIDGDNASCEVNSFPACLSSAHPKWNASEFQCSICYELLLNPVVGSCGHDFCKHCIEEWKVSRQLVGQAVLCPICRAVLLPSADQSFGVCIRLRETIEKLFPEQVAIRRQQAVLATHGHKCAAFPLPPSSPSSSMSTSTSGTSTDSSTATTSNTATTNSSDPTTATATTSSGSPVGSLGSPSSGGGAPGPHGGASPYPLLDLDLLNRAAEQYRELSLLVSAITSVPTPPAAVVQAFTHAAASMADHISSRPGITGTLPAAAAAAPLQTQQAAELARLFLSSGAALTSTAAASAAAAALQHQHQNQHSLQQQQSSYAQPYSQMHRQESPFTLDPAAAAAAVATMSGPDAAASAAMAAQLAASAAASTSGGPPAAMAVAARNAGFLEAALTLLTSAAATSTAAGQLRTLVSALHHQQQAAAEAGSRGSPLSDSAMAQGAAAMAASNAAGDMLRTTANTVQQLTAEAAAMSQLLRMHHQQQLQAHMQAAVQAQAAAQAQAQAQQLLQLHAAQQQAQVHYLGPYLTPAGPPQTAPPPPPPPTPPHMLISWANGLTTTAGTSPVVLLGGSPPQPATQQPHAVYSIAAAVGNQQAYAVTPSYQQHPYTSAPVAAATAAAAVSAAVPTLELYGWGQAVGTGNHQETVTGPTWPAGATGPLCYPLTAAHVRFQYAQPFMTVAATAVDGGGGGSSSGPQPMQVSEADHLMESSANATAPSSPHSRQHRQQGLIQLSQQQPGQQHQQQVLLPRHQAQPQAQAQAVTRTGITHISP
ncbi:hypothetical protein Vafri_6936 [Volvox africanus]|uniref:RING-type domain-containing protein n=1 Tax=Volvox africanus TaxID=51714 RepID=A0A8J4B164_9CHLO|nr:hypothetical protein Vafri_6936 [Volvox africanus]